MSVRDRRNDIEVAGAEFVVKGDALAEVTVAARNIVAQTLADEDIVAQFGVEAVIAFGVFRRLVTPESFSENSTGENARCQR